MKTKMKNPVFTAKMAMDSRTSKIPTPPVLSCFMNGMSQPPKNSVAMSALDVAMLAYSEIGNIENFIALYSVWYPAMSSDSASGRSNGNRFVSANAATMKMKNEIVSVSTFQMCMPACWSTISLSVTLPASSSTGMSDMPIAISYDTIWALERNPPSSAYLLFDDQPASTMPYTPSDAMASVNRKPTGRSATTIGMRPQRESHGAPNGMTAQATSAGMNASIGASRKMGLFTCPGIVSSFMMFFTPSAAGWSSPSLPPTRFGPSRP